MNGARTLVWDIPTRLFHWLFAASFAVAWLTAEGDEHLAVHVFCGYLMLGLIAFRLLWGVAGGYYARFATFRLAPRAGFAYLLQALRGGAARHLGHNPAGAQAVYLLLALGLAAGLSGLIVLGGEEQHGAAAGWLDYGVGKLLKEGHEMAATLMLLTVGAHLAGVALESWLHQENLVRAMITGNKAASPGSPASRPHLLTGVALALAVGGFAMWWFIAGQHIAFSPPKLADNPVWREECGSCHQAFHPSLLPARSWEKLLSEQASHFGVDLALEDATNKTLRAYMLANAAERHASEAAFKIERSVKPGDAPLRITETPYWIKKHHAISDSEWRRPEIKSPANCGACHRDADAGTFEDAAVRIL